MNIKTPHGTFTLTTEQDFYDFMNYNQDWDGLIPLIEDIINGGGYIGAQIYKFYTNWQKQQEALAAANETGDWSQYQQTISQNGIPLTPEQTEYMNNQVSNQRTEEARQYETTMRDSSLLSAGNQLQQLGLSPSNVIQTGGVSSNGVAAANVSNRNHSAQMAVERYQQKMQMARSMIGMVGSMASAGIYGGALGAAKKASSVMAAASAHSGLKALRAGPSIADVSKAFGLKRGAPDFGGDNSNFF